ncbi:MAG: inositol monophosphatase [Desulfobacterales bacterium CG07_land_8_20_14_0_80_52_14]|nr:MAG: inositol monophosphatase [Desulfobacterales bacterium CG07_land_8_20_14_0_80_52_14]
MDLDRIKRVAMAAAGKGGAELTRRFGKLSRISTKKGIADLVTDADIAAEAAILKTIRSAFPDHAVLAEESGAAGKETASRWIIDPLDGTTNYAHGLRIYCVSIAFASADEVLVGVILSPPLEELFIAVKGCGATLNGKPIRVTDARAVAKSLLVTGFPHNPGPNVEPMIRRFRRCLEASRGVRRLGSAALDICYVACGRFDAFWEQNLNPWDTAAGFRIALEAGATVTDYDNRPFTLENKSLLVTNGHIHDEMLSLLDIRNEEDPQ